MNKLMIVLGLVLAQQVSYAQLGSKKDSVIINTDRGVKIKIAVPRYTDISNIGKVDPAFQEIIKNKDFILKSVSNGDYPLKVTTHVSPDGIWSIKTKDYPEHGKELAFNVNGGLVKNKITADTILFELSGDKDIILIIDDFSSIDSLSDLSLDKMISDATVEVIKEKVTKVNAFRGEYELAENKLIKIKNEQYSGSLLSFGLGANLSLLKGELSPGIDVKMITNIVGRDNEMWQQVYTRASFNYLFEFDEDDFQIHPQTFLRVYYTNKTIKNLFGRAYVGAGVLLNSKNDFHQNNMYSLSFLFPMGKNGPLIGLDLNFEDNFKSFHPGLNINF
jgi:hypothetical protein